MKIAPAARPTASHVDLNNKQNIYRLETLDYIPFISMASGTARFSFGVVQTVGSIGQDVLSFIDYCRHPSQGSTVNDGTTLYLNGKINMLRGSVAICPFFGNIALYLYDQNNSAEDSQRRMAGIVAVGL